MVLNNHIAKRLLEDTMFTFELISGFNEKYEKWVKKVLTLDRLGVAPDKWPEATADLASLYSMISATGSKNYLVTNTVMSKLDMLHVKKNKEVNGNMQYDWSVFKDVSSGKRTFILPNNEVLRVDIVSNVIWFLWITFKFDYPRTKQGHGQMLYHMFYVDKPSYAPCNHFESKSVDEKSEFVYKIMCFIYLSEIEEVELKSGQKKGTKKTEKVINTLKEPIIIIDSRWNITSIRTEGFSVSGHFAIRWCGVGREEARMVWIDPFEKKGYVRKATKEGSHE